MGTKIYLSMVVKQVEFVTGGSLEFSDGAMSFRRTIDSDDWRDAVHVRPGDVMNYACWEKDEKGNWFISPCILEEGELYNDDISDMSLSFGERKLGYMRLEDTLKMYGHLLPVRYLVLAMQTYLLQDNEKSYVKAHNNLTDWFEHELPDHHHSDIHVVLGKLLWLNIGKPEGNNKSVH